MRGKYPVKVKVSRHITCSWNWMLSYLADDDPAETGYFVTLQKAHPLWTLFEELLDHMPSLLRHFIRDSDRYEALEERYCAKVARLQIPPEMAKILWFPLWEAVEAYEDDNE